MRGLLLSGAAFAALACGATATAQEVVLEEVVVTAQKRTENLQDVPIAVSAVGAERVEQLHATRLADLTAVAPNFSVEKANGTVYIRGVGGGGRNIGFGGRAGVYLDGVYIGQAAALSQSLLDIEHVEVLRGPQGHLFGRNTVSGAANIITRAPAAEFGGEVTLGAGNLEYRSLGLRADLPIVEDKVLAKLSVGLEKRDGYTRNLFDNNRVIGSLDSQSYRGAVRLLPNEKVTVDVSADYMRDKSFRGGPESVSSLTGAGLVDPLAPNAYEVNTNTPRFKHVETGGGAVNVNYEQDDGSTITSITAYRTSKSAVQADNDYTPIDFLHTLYEDEFRQLSQELRIASSDESRLRYVAGVFLLSEEADTKRVAAWGAAAVGLGLGLAPNSSTPSSAGIRTTSYALFGSLDYDLTERLTVNLGGRYTIEQRKLRYDLDGSNSGLVGIATLKGFKDEDEENRFSPSIGVTFKANDDLNLYAKYSTGFKSGGWNVDFLNRNQVKDLNGDGRADFAFDTETVQSYEIGAKAELFERRVRLNAAVFAADYDDYQINRFVQFPGGITVIQLSNAAKVETKGVEVSFEAAPIRNLLLTLDAAYMDATFDDFKGGGPGGADASGNELPFSPKWSGTASAQYRFDLPSLGSELTLFGQYAYRAKTYAGQENQDNQRLGERKLLNARATFTHLGTGLSVSVWGSNITDQDYLTNRTADFLGTKFVERGEPQTYGLEVTARF
ncbi:TonB-dependent receptor [Caulobacter mirabilis]|uniref:TonB-dependent receptor n=1 Tax=Caulobacter mirabilis TaxID=69666 RepID=A0A2D2AWA1_9CAUL|nr:TonB-dependent receptor [Caulobacter mirabilis]ATQ42251.1 hypothetical protein CSW64_07385 [Caulobacter mirabilis]